MEANIINDNFVHDSNYKRIYIKQNMDYEEKYKKTLEKARKELQACGSVDCDAAKQIFRFFPELAEAEDEKIRKDIIEAIKKESKDFPSSVIAEKSDTWLAWLEKQGEQKSAWSEEDEKTWKELIEEVKDQLDFVPAPDCRDKEDEKVLKQLNKWLAWLKSLKERYTWKPSEEQLKALNTMNVTGCITEVGQGKSLIELYNDLKKLREE